MKHGIGIIILRKDDDQYVFIFRTGIKYRRMLFRALNRYASNPELNFRWSDASSVAEAYKDTIREIRDREEFRDI